MLLCSPSHSLHHWVCITPQCLVLKMTTGNRHLPGWYHRTWDSFKKSFWALGGIHCFSSIQVQYLVHTHWKQDTGRSHLWQISRWRPPLEVFPFHWHHCPSLNSFEKRKTAFQLSSSCEFTDYENWNRKKIGNRFYCWFLCFIFPSIISPNHHSQWQKKIFRNKFNEISGRWGMLALQIVCGLQAVPNRNAIPNELKN